MLSWLRRDADEQLYGLADSSFLASRRVMSRRIGPHRQGQLQGANVRLMGVANPIGPGLRSLGGAAKD